MLRFKAIKGFTLDKDLEKFTLSKGFELVKGKNCFLNDFMKAFKNDECYPEFCQNLIDYNLMPVEIERNEKVDNIGDFVKNFRDEIEEAAFEKNRSDDIDIVEFRIVIFLAIFVRLQNPYCTYIHYSQLAEFVLPEKISKQIFKLECFSFAYDKMFGYGSFRLNFKSNVNKQRKVFIFLSYY